MGSSYRDLVVWQRSIDLVAEIYAIARELPRSERNRLGDQITRAAVSVPTNIAEGYGRGAPKDFARFLSIARGSLLELETHLLITVRVGFLTAEELEPTFERVSEISRMLSGLRKYLRARSAVRE